MVLSATTRAGIVPILPPVTRPRTQAAVAVPQQASLAFGAASSAAYDGTARLSDAALGASTTRLSLSLDLRANQRYSFSFYYRAGGPRVTLVDSAGKATAVNMAQGFTVARGGTYQLKFEANAPLQALGLDALAVNARSVLPTTSGNTKIDPLLMGGSRSWWHDAGATATVGAQQIAPGLRGLDAASSRHALTYSFLDAPQAGKSADGFQAMTDAQKNAVRAAFDEYAKLIDVTFTETQSGGGDINFGTDVQTGSAGYASMPTGPDSKAYVYLANNAASNSDAGVARGGYGWMTILHEVGHALGLKHPGNYDAAGGKPPGPFLPSTLDNRQNTMMSYHDNAQSRGVYSSTPMVLDIAALQYLYGAKTGASNTDVQGGFRFDPAQPVRRTLWSATGEDTVDLTGLQKSSNVNLNAGSLSSINIQGPASSPSYSGNGNVGIAYGSRIDKVKLSDAAGVADTVSLNDAWKRDAFDTIGSFEAGVDKIALSRAVFGALSATQIEFGSAATKASSRIVVNNSTGEVFYDADGSGTRSAARKIAQLNLLQPGATLAASSFVVTA